MHGLRQTVVLIWTAGALRAVHIVKQSDHPEAVMDGVMTHTVYLPMILSIATLEMTVATGQSAHIGSLAIVCLANNNIFSFVYACARVADRESYQAN